MSLINKMLKDLETRQNTPPGESPARPIFQDLRAVSDDVLHRKLLPVLTVALVALALAAALYVWTHRAMPSSVSAGPRTTELAQAGMPAVPPAQDAVPPAPPSEALPAPLPAGVAPVVATSKATANLAEPPPASTKAAGLSSPPASPPPPRAARIAPPNPPKPTEKAADTRKNAVRSDTSAAPIAGETGTGQGSMEKKDIPLTPEQTAENTYRAAAQQWQQRHPDEAEQGFKSALAVNPRHIAARELLAGLLLERGRMDEARLVLEQGVASVPGHPGFVTLLARLYAEQGMEVKAIALLDQQRARTRPEPDTLALLATLYQRAGRHAEAIGAYKDALHLRPLEGKWWVGLGISLEAEQNWTDARFAYERVRDTNIEPRLARYAEQRLAIVRTK